MFILEKYALCTDQIIFYFLYVYFKLTRLPLKCTKYFLLSLVLCASDAVLLYLCVNVGTTDGNES